MTLATTAAKDTEMTECVACGDKHPKWATIRVMPSGLACGLDCMTEAQRQLLLLPTVEEAAKRCYPDRTVLHTNLSRPRDHFELVMTSYPSSQVMTDLGVDRLITKEHIWEVVDSVGLHNAAGHPPGRKLNQWATVWGMEVEYAVCSDLSQDGDFQVWITASTASAPHETLACARATWTDESSEEAVVIHAHLSSQVKAAQEADASTLENEEEEHAVAR